MLKPGRPTTAKTQKEKALEAMQDVEEQEPVKMQRFNVDLPEELHRKIKIQAVKEGLKINGLTMKIFNEYLSKVSNDHLSY